MAEGRLGKRIKLAAFGMLVGPIAPRAIASVLAQSQWLEYGKVTEIN